MSLKSKLYNFFREIWCFISSRQFLKNIALLIGISLSVFVLLFYLVLPRYTRHDEEIKIIDITNLTVDQAKKMLKGLDLKLIVTDSTYNPDKSPEIILEQQPTKDSRVKPNRTVYVTVNTSQAPAVNLYYKQIIGEHFDQVRRKFKSLDLQIGKITYVPGKAANTIKSVSLDDKIIFTEVDPRKGERPPSDAQNLNRGTVLNLEIFKGEELENKSIPNLICSTFEEAEFMILANEYLLGTVHVDPSVKKDTASAYVVKQSPRVGVEASMGTTIDIWLEKIKPEDCKE